MHLEEKNSKIKLLPEHIIDQIKAGEVIERPASLIKEILENSLDAKATSISLHLVNNGLELIELIDNGVGMSFDELPLAFYRHATSKIRNFEDLYKLHSYGFRGEALASLASVAKVRCTSLEANHKGGKLTINGGEFLTHVPHEGTEQGTSLYIKELFYNTPARLKFIKSKTAEKNALIKVIHGFLLSTPELSFELKWDDKDKEIYPGRAGGDEGLKARIKDLFLKKNFSPEDNVLLKLQSYHQCELKLCLIADEAMQSGAKCQYIIVNGRQIQDRQIHSLISHFADKVGEKNYSQYFLSLTLPPEDLDVNVHPNKLFVKFHNAGEVMGLISASLKSLEVQKPKLHPSEVPMELNLDQKFSLKDLREKKESPEMSLEEEMALATFNTKRNVQTLSKNFCLKNEIEGDYLIHIPRLMQNFLLKDLNLDDAVPLMISEPISWNKGDELLPHLKAIGFECDRLNAQTLALRTLPKNFERMNTRFWFQSFLEFASQKADKVEKSLEHFLEKNSDQIHYDNDLLTEAMNSYSTDDLQELKIGVLLSDQVLNKLF